MCPQLPRSDMPTGQAGPFFLEYPSKLIHIIMEEDVNRVSAVDMEAPGRVANQLSIEEKQKLMEYYSKQLEMMYPIASPGMTDKAGLVTLQKRNTRLIEMLTLFDRSWADEISVIQKAVLQYLATEGISKKERLRIVEVWGDWTTFLLDNSRFRVLLGRFLQYHQRQACELNELLKTENMALNVDGQSINNQDYGE